MKTFYDQFHPAVEKTLSIKTEHKVGERMLGEKNREQASLSL